MNRDAHKKPVVEYLDEQFQLKVPFIMYADFESILEPIQGPVTTLAYHQQEELTYIHHLGGAFIPNSLMEKS